MENVYDCINCACNERTTFFSISKYSNTSWLQLSSCKVVCVSNLIALSLILLGYVSTLFATALPKTDPTFLAQQRIYLLVRQSCLDGLLVIQLPINHLSLLLDCIIQIS